MEWCLWDETIGEGNPKDTCYARGDAEQEEIPVEACRFAEWEFCSLCNERGD